MYYRVSDKTDKTPNASPGKAFAVIRIHAETLTKLRQCDKTSGASYIAPDEKG